MRFGRDIDEGLIMLGEYGGDVYESARERRAGRGITAKAFYAFAAALAVWVFAYGSGLFPWLGTAEIDDTHARPFDNQPGSSLTFGIGTMLLFEGQTAFFEYESTSTKSEIIFDVKPVTVLGYSPAMKRVKGVAKGRIEVPITATGLYNFRHGPALGRPYGLTAYTVSWGAS